MILFWLASFLLALGGTFHWFHTARHGANREYELLGLFGSYLLLALTTALIVGVYLFAWYAFKGFNPG